MIVRASAPTKGKVLVHLAEGSQGYRSLSASRNSLDPAAALVVLGGYPA
ncbi:MAG: hypothetical protein MUE52_00985 [Tabrizicola sp.]|nr:hypothetical protein [Tabrizicola sp.]